MRALKILFVLVAVFWLAGCASSGKYLPEHALTNPAESISVPHPVELEKAGIEVITTFVSVMDPGLWIEVVAGGGVWPTLALTPNGKILKGYAFLTNINYWGDFLLQFVFCCSQKELAQAKILYFNRDAGWGYRLVGNEVRYEPKKFDRDKEYQTKFFTEFGMSLSGLNDFWIDYLKEKEINPYPGLSSVHEVIVGSTKWQEYKEKLAVKMQHNYKMADGEIRCGYLPLDTFRQIAVETPGFNGKDRYLKQAKLPLIALPFYGAGMLVMAGASVVSDTITAGVNDDWTGYYARAKIMRYQMAPLFRQICQIYKELLKARDEEIKGLKTNLFFQKILNEN